MTGVATGFSPKTSSNTLLLHLGHRGSASASMTYMRHLGQPTSIMEVASGLLEYRWVDSSWLSSDDKHELGGDVGDAVAGDSTWRLALGGDKFNFKSSFGPLRRLIFLFLPFREIISQLEGREIWGNFCWQKGEEKSYLIEQEHEQRSCSSGCGGWFWTSKAIYIGGFKGKKDGFSLKLNLIREGEGEERRERG